MSELFESAIVEKRNVLNELRSNNMTLQELRLFSIYLSKINPYNIETRVVRFPLDDFRRIMGLGYDMNITHFKSAVRGILQKIVEVPNESGSGYTAFQLFKRAKLEKNELDEWYVEFNAHDDALPLMFDFKDKYFKYELWNALRLKSPNQVRMYEILKQYERAGKRELTVSNLRELLGIAPSEYTYWQNFKVRVLDSCQEALKQTTDICYTYERGKVGKGGKWLSIVFHIKKNTEYIDQLTLDEFIEMQPNPEPIETDSVDELNEQELDYGSELANFLGEACDHEFTPEQIRILKDLVLQATHYTGDHNEMYRYLVQQINVMNYYNPQKEKRFSYLKNMIENDIKEK